MPPGTLFDHIGVRLNDGPTSGKSLVPNVIFADLNKQHDFAVENGTLNDSTESAANSGARS
jgi:alkyl sulfatase BDS1-like metallo-beta-lactamase superfamily hydrolase